METAPKKGASAKKTGAVPTVPSIAPTSNVASTLNATTLEPASAKIITTPSPNATYTAPGKLHVLVMELAM